MDKWLKKALPKGAQNKAERPELCHIHASAVGTFAANGERLHFIPASGECDCRNEPEFPRAEWAKTYPAETKLMDILETARQGSTVVTVSTKPFLQGVKSAKAFIKTQAKVYLNGVLSVAGKSAEFGEVVTALHDGDSDTDIKVTRKGIRTTVFRYTYQHSGPDAEFLVNPSYLEDALEGMGETTTLRYNGTHIYLTSGEAEAVIMKMEPHV